MHKKNRLATISELCEGIEREEKHPLKLYRPWALQEPFHRATCSEALLWGGKRTSVRGTTVWKLPKRTNCRNDEMGWSTTNAIPVRIENIREGDWVVGFQTESKRIDQKPTLVTGIANFQDDAFEVITKRGYRAEYNAQHPLWCCPPLEPKTAFNRAVDPDWRQGRWQNVGEMIPHGWFVRMGYGPYRRFDIASDDDAYFRGLMDGDGWVPSHGNQMGFFTHANESDLREFVVNYLRGHGVDGSIKTTPDKNSLGVSVRWCNAAFTTWYNGNPINDATAERMKGWLQGFIDAEGCVTKDGKVVIQQKRKDLVIQVQQWLLMFGIKCSVYHGAANMAHGRPNDSWRLQISGKHAGTYCKVIGFRGKDKRERADALAAKWPVLPTERCFWDRIASVEKIGLRDFVGMSTSLATYISNGMYSHNSGKTAGVSMEFVSRIIGRPITFADGTQMPLRFPVAHREFPRQYWVIGWNWDHAATIFKYLFLRGQGGTLRCIRDRESGQWRLWNRANADDAARETESELTQPLIPPEMIVGGLRGIAWEEPKKRQWKTVTLTNGATITYFPSNQVTAQPGEAVSGVWIDEDIQNPAHLQEWQDRLIDLRGWFLWSVWPQTRNNALLDLMDRADACRGDPKPAIQSFQLDMLLNPFIDQASKEEAIGRMTSDDEIARRTRGDMNLPSLLMYQAYAPIIHCLRHTEFDKRMQADMHAVRRKLTDILMDDGKFPRGWTRYFSIDPSHTRTACHSWVVPPPIVDGVEMGNVTIVEWELILERKTAAELATEVRPLMAGFPYEAFIMDQQIGKQTNTGRDETVFAHYEMAFRKEGIISRQTMSGFLPGCNEPQTRYRTIRRMLAIQPNGMPMLLMVEDRVHYTKKEFLTYRKRIETGRDGMKTMLDAPANPRVHDAIASLEYGGTFICGLMDQGLAYVEPSAFVATKSTIQKVLEEIKAQDSNGQPQAQYVHFGPGARA